MKGLTSRVLLTIWTAWLSIAVAQQPTCSKIDFNRATLSEFTECYQLFLPLLDVKKYAERPEIRPYRPTSLYYLSPSAEGLACLESKTNFQLDENSIVQAAIYVDFKDAGASLSINVIDLVQNVEAYVWKYERPTKWIFIEEKITKKLPRALVRPLDASNCWLKSHC